ncbi:MAG TPA: hypothetical protein PK141_03090 [Polyangiaceae bacterium]|nr:hypothetical protein [Polyangiaceae bacterium]
MSRSLATSLGRAEIGHGRPIGARATAMFAATLTTGALLAGCASDAPTRVPTRAAPEVVATSDESFVLQASAYVELHLWLIELAARPSLRAPAELARAREAYTVVLDAADTDALASRTTRDLSGCGSAACAQAALRGARLDEVFSAALPWFLARAWPKILARTDLARARLRASLPETFPRLLTEVVAAVDARAPGRTFRLDVVHADPRYRGSPLAPLALEDTSPCLRGREEDRPEAIACALFQVALDVRDDSTLFRRLERAAGREPGARARARRLYSLAAAHAVRVATRAATGTSREGFTASLLDPEPEAAIYLARHYAERATPRFLEDLDKATSR